MTDADWLRAVAAAPADPLVRLAYADWLDDQGDGRGELLRLDVELGDRPDNAPVRRRLCELLRTADPRWVARVCREPATFDGWVDEGFCECAGPAELAPDLFVWLEGYPHHLTRQPRTRPELAAVVAAARGCRLRAVRYTGSDPVVLRLLAGDRPPPARPAAGAAGPAVVVVLPAGPPGRQPPGWAGSGWFVGLLVVVLVVRVLAMVVRGLN